MHAVSAVPHGALVLRRGGSSKGVRNFLETMLVPFAEHPAISIQVAIRPHRYPQVVAEYLVDEPKRSLKGLGAHQVSMRIKLLRDVRRSRCTSGTRRSAARPACRARGR